MPEWSPKHSGQILVGNKQSVEPSVCLAMMDVQADNLDGYNEK